MQLLLSGSIPSTSEPRGATALLAIVDPTSGEILHRCEYQTPREIRAPEQKMQFTGFNRAGNSLYVCSHTEVVVFDEWPPRRPAGRISIPGFNDLHHCLPWGGGLAIANTGLETVDLVSFDGELLERWDVLSAADRALAPIEPGRDYRTLNDTKPHYAHPNHLFSIDGELWVTQLRTRRASPVEGGAGEAPIPIASGMPHDGSPIAGRLAFTTVNGGVVLVDPERREVVAEHDLKALDGSPEHAGWCRGMCGDPERAQGVFVAFTRPRKTRWTEFRFRVRHGYGHPPSRICRYDLGAGELRGCSEMSDGGRHLVIFQLEALPRELWV